MGLLSHPLRTYYGDSLRLLPANKIKYREIFLKEWGMFGLGKISIVRKSKLALIHIRSFRVLFTPSRQKKER